MEDWALIRRLVVEGVLMARIAERLGISRTTVVKLASASEPPNYERTPTDTSLAVFGPCVKALPAEFSDLSSSVPAHTISRVLVRLDEPRLAECDPLSGEVVRFSSATPRRYEKDRLGELVHVDLKKLGRVPDGGG